jgi:ankyrin repeat protein
VNSIAASPAEVIQAIRNNDLAVLQRIAPGSKEANEPTDRGTTPLMYAAGFGSVEGMKMLIDAAANVNGKNAFGATALMWGIGNPAKVKLLIAKGADVNARSKSGATPLLLAADQDGSEPAVRMLLAAGADIKARDGMGRTMLLAASSANNTSVAKLALESGLDVNAADASGTTPLMNAAAAGNTQLVKLLIARGANVNAVSGPPVFPVKNGIVQLGNFTALMYSASYGPPETVKALLESGARVDARDARGMTPLHFAVSSEAQNPAIVRLLLEKKADPAALMETRETPGDWALKFGRPEVLALFPGTRAERVKSRGAGVEEAVNQPVDLRAAAQKSLALLQKTSNSFFLTGGCSSCHAQAITAMAVEVGHRRGIAVDEAATLAQMPILKGQWSSAMDSLILRQDPPGGSDTIDFALFALAAAGYRPDTMTDAMVHDLAAMQLADGSWPGGGIARVPIEDSTFTRVAMSIRALEVFAPAGLRVEFRQRIDRAAKWLGSNQPAWTEERDLQLLGLHWAGADAGTIQRQTQALMDEQRPDGGWSQNPYLGSDAYATGQALYALNQGGGLDSNDPVYRRGVAYLLRTQHADGSWHVKSRAVKFQPYFQSGFPYDHDQWISAQATGWASMALSLAVSPGVKAAD